MASKRMMDRIKAVFVKNLFLKIIAIVFGVLLWAYTLVVLNPVRTMLIEDVVISLEGDTDLLSRNLILVSSDLGLATVNVSAEITNQAAIDNTRIDCTGSLSTITMAGTYTLPLSVSVQSNLGTVLDVSPQRVTVEVDKLISKSVPVSLVLQGELPEGYEVLSKTSATSVLLTGASRYILPAVRAEARVDLSNRTASVEEAVTLVFLDKEGNEITVITRSGESPSASVVVDISAVKEVPVEARTELPHPDYYDASVILSRETVKLSGDADVLGEITSVKTEPIIPEETVGTQEMEIPLVLPDGTALTSGQSGKLTATVTVTEATGFVLDLNVPIIYEGLDSDLTLSSDKPATALVDVYGPVKLLETISAESLVVKVDLSGLSEGSYEVSPVLVRNDELTGLSYTLQEPSFQLNIHKKTEG